MKTFKWCPEVAVRRCQTWFPDAHVHICIRSIGAQITKPSCKASALHLNFHDLDLNEVRAARVYAEDIAKGEEYAKGCMNEQQARQIYDFVEGCPDHLLIVVNCEAGVSRSPGVVLALRAKYGGDTEEPYQKAYPNVYVASTLGRVLGVGPFEKREIKGLITTNLFGDDVMPDDKEGHES